jgi:isocitrate dehydrogenase
VTLRQTGTFLPASGRFSIQRIESPVKHPERVDMVRFRENTEDVYAGSRQAGSVEAKRLIAFLRDEMGASVDEESGIGIKT